MSASASSLLSIYINPIMEMNGAAYAQTYCNTLFEDTHILGQAH